MFGFRFGAWGLWGASVGFALCFAESAAAQATASFPAQPGTPPATAPPAPTVQPAPGQPASALSVALPSAPAPPVDSTTASRYPVFAAPAAPASAPQQAAPSSLGPGFYPAILPYRDGLPIPPGYRVEHRSANGLIAGGLSTLIVAYGAALIVGAGDSFGNGTGWLVVPVAGPWGAIGARSFHCTNDPLKATKCVNNAFSEVQTIAILSADAVVQATGAVLFLAGLGSGEDELVRSDLETGVRVTPRAVGTSGFGIGFDGRF